MLKRLKTALQNINSPPLPSSKTLQRPHLDSYGKTFLEDETSNSSTFMIVYLNSSDVL